MSTAVFGVSALEPRPFIIIAPIAIIAPLAVNQPAQSATLRTAVYAYAQTGDAGVYAQHIPARLAVDKVFEVRPHLPRRDFGQEAGGVDFHKLD